MTAFWISALALAALALAFVLPPLLRPRAAPVTRDASNVAIYRDQLRELDADLAAGLLDPERHEEARREIERRLLDDVDAAHDVRPAIDGGRKAAAALALALPVAAIFLYFAVGTPRALAPAAVEGENPPITREQIEGMVARLAARMKENPDDLKGWVMLGRSYAVLDRHREAADAYANAIKHSPPDAQLLADYADALAMAQDRRFQGEPERLVAEALKLDPDNVKALALAGTIAFEKKDFKGAIAHWERILAVLPPDSEMAGPVRDGIADARAAAGLPDAARPGPQSAAAKAVSGTARLAPGLAAKAAPDDTVFIFARAAEGPRMPLAVLRKRVRDLPVSFKLDDSMAMSPAAKLSDQPRVVIGARISKSGNPAPQPGDLEGYSSPVKVGDTGIAVTIDREVGAPPTRP